MAEFTNVSAQEVAANGNVIFTNTAVQGNNCIKHREGSGIVTLRGITNQCRARYFVDFSANIAVPTGGTAGAISLAIAISGEPVLSSQMISKSSSRYDMARRGYTDARDTHKDKDTKMRELESYMTELGKDVTDLISDMTPEERTLAKSKLATLINKM